jgi:hypothetical protein
MLEERYVWYLVAAPWISGTVGAAISYWVAETYITVGVKAIPCKNRAALIRHKTSAKKMKMLTMTASRLISQHKKAPDDAGAESLLDSF